MAVLRRNIRPHAFIARVPRAICQEGDSRRRIAEAERVIEIEVLQLVRSDNCLAGLESVGTLECWNQLRTDLRPEHIEQGFADVRTQSLTLRDPADDVLNQGFRYPRVYRVMRHVVAHTVRAPAERKLAEIARADDQTTVLVGQPEQMTG